MKKLLSFLLLFNCFFTSSFAQKNFLPSTIVTVNGDTLQGLINYRNWAKNPSKIEFKKNGTNESESFGTDSIVWFAIHGIDVYNKAIVSKDMAPVSLASVQEQDFRNEVQDTVFLRQVVSGKKLTLYELEDEKVHFYLQEQFMQPVELGYKVYLSKSNSGQVFTVNGFKNQLNKYASFDEKLLKLIDRARYNETDLKKVITSLDTTAAVEISESKASKPAVKTLWFIVGGGITRNSLTFSGHNYRNLQDNKVAPTYGYSIRAGVDISEKRHMQRMFLRSELAVGNFNYDNTTEGQNWLGEEETRTYAIQMSNITLALSGNYKVVNGNALKVYTGLGVNFNRSFYNKNAYTVYNKSTDRSTTEGGLSFENGWFNFPAKVGVNIKSIDMSIYTSLGGTFSNFLYISTKYKTSGLYFMYRF